MTAAILHLHKAARISLAIARMYDGSADDLEAAGEHQAAGIQRRMAVAFRESARAEAQAPIGGTVSTRSGP